MHAPKWSAPSRSPNRPACNHVFTRTLFDEAAPAGRPDRRCKAGSPGSHSPPRTCSTSRDSPLAAGSVVLSHAPAAKADAVAVARLRAAGGVLTGRTNMTEFAFSGVGVNPHHGTPANASDCRHAAHSGRLFFRRRHFGGYRRGVHRAGLRHRRLYPHSRGAERHRGLQEHRPTRSGRRRPAAVDHPRHRLRHDAIGAGCRHRARNPRGAPRDCRRSRPGRIPAGRGEERLLRRHRAGRGPRLRRRAAGTCAPPAPRSRKSSCRNWRSCRPSTPPAAFRRPRLMPGTGCCWNAAAPATTRALRSASSRAPA